MRTTNATLVGVKPKAYESAGDFIDAVIDALHDESPGSMCYGEDTIRFVLTTLLEESED